MTVAARVGFAPASSRAAARTEPSLAAPLHPGAWWLWAIGLGTAATQTNNPLLLGLVVGVTGIVAVTCRAPTPWAAAYGVFLRLGLAVLAIRTAFHVVVGGVAGTTVLFRLPEVPLPDWAVGIRLGGAVTLEGLLAAAYDGLRLAVLLACVGAANALANPKRLLRSLPAALYELSVAVVVALSAAPQFVISARRVRRARLLRGDTAGGWRSLRSILVPVLEDALARSIDLAASMDSRGYGRVAGATTAGRRFTSALVVGGLLGIAVGAYGILDVGAGPGIGWPALVTGAVLAAAGIGIGGRRVGRTRYRPDRWRWRESVVAASGLAATALVLLAGAQGVALTMPVAPVTAPRLPWLPTVGVLVALLPLAAAPRPGRGGPPP